MAIPRQNFETVPIGTTRALDGALILVADYERALKEILVMDSCLLAEAQEIAKAVLVKHQ